MQQPEYLLKLYYNRELRNEDFKLVLLYWIEEFFTTSELEGMRIVFGEVGGKWKTRSIQFKQKNKDKIMEQIFSVKIRFIILEKAEIHNGSRINHDFFYYFEISQPITVSMELEIDERSYAHINMMMNHRMSNIENRFEQLTQNNKLLHLKPNATSSNLVYGYLLIMDKSKEIIFYSESIGTPNLTQDEIRDKDLLNDNKQYLPCKIWKTTYLNIFNPNHIGSLEHLNKIKKIVGDNNVKIMDYGYTVVKLPMQLENIHTNLNTFNSYISDLNAVFLNYNKLIE